MNKNANPSIPVTYVAFLQTGAAHGFKPIRNSSNVEKKYPMSSVSSPARFRDEQLANDQGRWQRQGDKAGWRG